jgi:hypothetical protein
MNIPLLSIKKKAYINCAPKVNKKIAPISIEAI